MEIEMKTENQEKLINDKGDARAETLADLPVTDEQARPKRRRIRATC
jgi:hypothetical protein